MGDRDVKFSSFFQFADVFQFHGRDLWPKNGAIVTEPLPEPNDVAQKMVGDQLRDVLNPRLQK